MDDEFRQQVMEKLRRGEDLPAEWARELFPPERREYELVYHGKEREEEILAGTMAVPLQPVATFGSNGDEWHNMLVFGDNLQAMRTLLRMKERGELSNADGTPGVRLVYIDPPFATRQEFRGPHDQKAYQDKIAGSRFLEFIRQRLILFRELLSDDGCIYLHLDYRKVHYVRLLMDEIFGEQNMLNQIIWQRTAAHNDPGKYGCVHDTILLYRKGATWTWNAPKMRQSQTYIDKFFVYAESPDGKTWIKLKKGQEYPIGWRRYRLGNLRSPHPRPNLMYNYKGYPHPKNGWSIRPERMRELDEQNLLHFPPSRKGRIQNKQYLDSSIDNKSVSDTWLGISPIQAQSTEKQNYPTQKPEALLARIIEASSHSGDIVLDAFAGSGTTCAVAEKLRRRWVGIDCGKLAIYTMQKRMLTLKAKIGNKGRPLRPKPFTLYNAGLYDFSMLSALPWEDWKFFALRLFGCREETHHIGGIGLQGKLKGASVLVFNHHENEGRRIDEETIRDIHAAVGNKIGRRFFVIAPRAVFDFQQDYIDLDGVRYYALRIPYSIINELHRRDFTALLQPSDEDNVNNVVEAWGFDFIHPPDVAWDAGIGKTKGELIERAFLHVKRFSSQADIAGADSDSRPEALSMLMLDYDFNGEVFDFDSVFFGHQLEETGWRAWFPVEELGDNVMAVFIDIHGNEAREVIPRSEFRRVSRRRSRTKAQSKRER